MRGEGKKSWILRKVILEELDAYKLADEQEALAAFAAVKDPKRPSLDARSLGDRLRAVAGVPRNVEGVTLAFTKASRKTRSGTAVWTVSHGQHGQHGQFEAPARGNRNSSLYERENTRARTEGPRDDHGDHADHAAPGQWCVQ